MKHRTGSQIQRIYSKTFDQKMKTFLAITLLSSLALQCALGKEAKSRRAVAENLKRGNGTGITQKMYGDGSGASLWRPCNAETVTCSFPFICVPWQGELECDYQVCASDSDCTRPGTFCTETEYDFVCVGTPCETTSDCPTKDFVCKMTGHLFEERKSCVPGPCTKCGPDQKCQENTCVFDPCSQLIAIGVGVFFYMRKKKKDQAAKENAKMEEPPVFYKD